MIRLVEKSRGYYLPILCFISTILLKSCRGLRYQCGPNQFFDTESYSCKDCSSCKDSEIIRQTCTYSSDTVCGPFYEFSEFLKNLRPYISPERSTEPVTRELHADLKEDTWYSLTLVLIGCLCVSSIVLVVLIITAVLMYRKRMREKQLWNSNEGLHKNEISESMKDTDKMLSVYISET